MATKPKPAKRAASKRVPAKRTKKAAKPAVRKRKEPTLSEGIREVFIEPFNAHLQELGCAEDSIRARYLLHPDSFERLMDTGLTDLLAVCHFYLNGIYETTGGEARVQDEGAHPDNFIQFLKDEVLKSFRHFPAFHAQYSAAYERFYEQVEKHSSDPIKKLFAMGVKVFTAPDVTTGLIECSLDGLADWLSGKEDPVEVAYKMLMETLSDYLKHIDKAYVEGSQQAIGLVCGYMNALENA